MIARTLGLTAVLVALLAAPASAADFFVTQTHDDGNGVCSDAPANCTLRDALTEARPPDVVHLPDGVYELVEGELTLAGDTVIGAGARTTVIDALDDSRVFAAMSGTSVISGVTITGGNGEGAQLGRAGGGILVRLADLALVESHVLANGAGEGGGIANFGGTLSVMRSTISENEASQPTTGAEGGGIYSAGTTYLRNSTVSGNQSRVGEGDATGGGIFLAGGTFVSESSTIAGNLALRDGQQAPLSGSALAGSPLITTTATLTHTIIGDNGAGACDDAPFQGANNIIDDATCTTTVAFPALGPLANNGGPTDTHTISTSGPAVNVGGSCEPSDQRGQARVGPCDSGAYEASTTSGAPPVLWVVTVVVNDGGGTLTPGDVNVHVRDGGLDVAESPQTGDPAGRRYTISPNVIHVVSAPAVGYTTTVGGQCTSEGAFSMGLSTTGVCTVRLDDPGGGSQPPPQGGGGNQPPPPPGDDGDDELPAPEAGEEVNALPVSGTVRVKIAGTNRFVNLVEGQQIPVGSTVDTRKGRVTIVAAGNQRADFYDGIFRLTQGKGAKPLTTLTLVEALSCPRAGRAVAAAKKKKRRLWGDGSGKFRTKGKHSAATVVGTKWLVEDRCSSTLTRVTQGRVSVRDFVKKKTVIVRAGKKYVAKARKR
jgi:hypothetical protein